MGNEDGLEAGKVETKPSQIWASAQVEGFRGPHARGMDISMQRHLLLYTIIKWHSMGITLFL